MQQAFQFKKKYGQNFLKNSAIIDKIVTIRYNSQPIKMVTEQEYYI